MEKRPTGLPYSRRTKPAVYIDAWQPGTGEHMIPESELLPGELMSATFKVGYYTVCSTLKAYGTSGAGGSLAAGLPASKDEVEILRKDIGWENAYHGTAVSGHLPPWTGKLCITHEISAKHDLGPYSRFLQICRTILSRGTGEYEYIGDIYAVKGDGGIPNEGASLLVYSHYESSISGMDTWYRLDPSGKITTGGEDIENAIGNRKVGKRDQPAM